MNGCCCGSLMMVVKKYFLEKVLAVLVLCVVLDHVGVIKITVVKDAKDVLAGAVDVSAQEEVGEAKEVVLPVELVVTVGSHLSVARRCHLFHLGLVDSDELGVKLVHVRDIHLAVT